MVLQLVLDSTYMKITFSVTFSSEAFSDIVCKVSVRIDFFGMLVFKQHKKENSKI